MNNRGLETLENLNDIEKLDWLSFPYKWSNSADATLKRNCFEYLAKKLKALEIIKEKRVCTEILFVSQSVEVYNDMVDEPYKLTQEEYKLLKEVLE